ncbi:MAG: aspartate-semialdehyde dehydrogenase [Actinobacteria bacterium]|nr:MAG: aspartate-semialdehyde dehydrogenase [Actinomycetota bacterium]
MKEYRVAVVGATGMVGQAMREILEERGFPVSGLRLLASQRSRGRRFAFRGDEVEVEVLDEDSFRGIDLALFSAGAPIAKRFAPIAVEAGALVVDNSSAFRMDEGIPLVVPEVNPQDAFAHSGIIANPNCSTIQMVVVLKPLHDRSPIRRVIVSTYQSVSGTGKDAVEELEAQTREAQEGREPVARVYPHPIAFNCVPHIDVFLPGGYTREEMKMVGETRKIMGLPDLPVSATAVRVPVFTGHSESVNVEFAEAIEADEARNILQGAPGVEVVDDPENAVYPLALDAAGKDPCFVGRIRPDTSCPRALNLWIVSDNLRKGAALNAVQIAELVSGL